jgi:hypothetical protein
MTMIGHIDRIINLPLVTTQHIGAFVVDEVRQ